MEERQRCHHEQSRSCCHCNPVIEFANHGLPENAVKFVRPIYGRLKEVWGLGSVWVTNRGSYYGLYHDYETGECHRMFLGNTQHQAFSRLNHVKSFL